MSAAFVLPSRGALCLGDRVIMYLPRCADTNSEVRKASAQVSLSLSYKLILLIKISDLFFGLSVSVLVLHLVFIDMA